MVEEVTLRRKYLNSGDVFILDLGLHLIQVRNDSLACTYNQPSLVLTVDYTYTYCTLSALIDSLPRPLHTYTRTLQWNGKESNKDERSKAAEYMISVKVIIMFCITYAGLRPWTIYSIIYYCI